MPYLTVNNFKFGLDFRRDMLSSVPGSLIQADDGYITDGGSFEHRKAFVQVGNVKLPANTFGFERTLTGVTVFGSVAVGTLTLPAGVNYVQCLHPSDTSKAMTDVLCSCCFGGKAFCIAKFGTEIYWYLDGSLILPSIAGQVLSYYNGATSVVQTVAMIAAQLFNNLNSQGFADAGIFVENLSTTGFNIYTSYGIDWEPFVSVSTANSGKIDVSQLSTGSAPVEGSSGKATFRIYAGTGGKITAFNDIESKLPSGTNTYKMLSTAAVTFTTNVSNTVTLLAGAINAQSSGAGALAPTVAAADIVVDTLKVSTTQNLNSNYLQVLTTDNGATACNICVENMALDFSGVATGGSVSVKNIYVTNGTNLAPHLKYGGANPTEIVGNLTGTDNGGHPAFYLPAGIYLYVPGASDTGVSVNGTFYSKTNYPNGLVITHTNSCGFRGTGGIYATFQLFLLTDILAHAGITYTGVASLTTIANSITAKRNSTGFVASNTTASGAGTLLYISRGYNTNLNINASSYNNIYFYVDPAQVPGLSPAGFASITPPTQFGFGTAVNGVQGRGPTYKVTFSGTWVIGDQYTFNVVTAAKTYVAGIGNLTGLTPTQCITLNKRVHVIAGSQWLGSDNDDATAWEDQNAGAFSIDTSNEVDQPENLTSLAPYQGMMALFSNRTVQIWMLNADPNQIALSQVMANIGNVAGLTAQPMGDLDVIFLHTSGIRSLRARQALLNASVTDIGSPIDSEISGVSGDLSQLTATQIAASCGIVDPTQNRYWCYIPAKSLSNSDLLAANIYVLSYFPSNKIIAWSTFTPTANGVAIMPIKFVVFNQQVYFRAKVANGDHYVYNYGGSDGITYDTQTHATIQIPFYDAKKPGHEKYAIGFDIDTTGTWACYGSPNWVTNSLTLLGTFTSATFDNGIVPFEDVGTHFSFMAVSTLSTAHPTTVPSVTSIIFHYELGAAPAM